MNGPVIGRGLLIRGLSLVGALMALIVLLGLMFTTSATGSQRIGDVIPGRYIVVLEDGVSS